jgi:hypothetical protein
LLLDVPRPVSERIDEMRIRTGQVDKLSSFRLPEKGRMRKIAAITRAPANPKLVPPPPPPPLLPLLGVLTETMALVLVSFVARPAISVKVTTAL